MITDPSPTAFYCDHNRGETGDDGGGKQRGHEARGIAAMRNLVGDRRRDWGHQRDGLRHIAMT